jgi:3-carboxy-cis,cis-muconate cycloisomerase
MSTPMPVLDPGFTTRAVAEALSPAGRVEAMGQVEGAVAQALADVGLVERGVADRIVRACLRPTPDPASVLARGWADGSPVRPLLEHVRDHLEHEGDAEAVRWLHRGATTQDVVDTAAVLNAREALSAVRGDLVAVGRRLAVLAADDRDVPAAGVALLQPAAPTTWGRRWAGWLSPVLDHLDDLDARVTALPVQLGGATGTLPELGADGPAVVTRVAAWLDLAVPPLPWHGDRGPVEQVAALLGRIARTAGTVASGLLLLAGDGRLTLRSRAADGHRSSPVDAVRARAAAQACGAAVAGLLTAPPHELERAAGPWQAEWLLLPLALHTAAAAVEGLRDALDGVRRDDRAGAPDGAAPTPSAQTWTAEVLERAEGVLNPAPAPRTPRSAR